MRYNTLLRRFAGLTIEDVALDYPVLPESQVRQLEHTVAGVFFAEIMSLAKRSSPLPWEHLSVGGMLSPARIGRKSVLPKSVFEMPAGARVGKANNVKIRACKPLALKTYGDTLHERSLASMV